MDDMVDSIPTGISIAKINIAVNMKKPFSRICAKLPLKRKQIKSDTPNCKLYLVPARMQMLSAIT